MPSGRMDQSGPHCGGATLLAKAKYEFHNSELCFDLLPRLRWSPPPQNIKGLDGCPINP